MTENPLQSCIDTCNACADACDFCSIACLKEQDAAAMTRCIALDIDCGQACRIAAAFMARGSSEAAALCRFCAQVCKACGEECGKHAMDHCRRCADACHKCADACERMAAAA